MRPKPFLPTPYETDAAYVRDLNRETVWHVSRLRTLYVDTDRSQVVYHANYLRYFEFGRASLMRHAAYSYREIETGGFIYPIISTGLDYFRPLHYDDAMLIYTRPGKMERVKLQFDYIITHEVNGDIACIGFTKHCCTNSSGTPVEIDPKTLHLWQNFPQ